MSAPKTPPAANDNNPVQETTLSVSDLARGMGVDEDILLQRLAEILSKRTQKP